MPNAILQISGPSGSGKTTLARLLASIIPIDQIHLIRFAVQRGDAWADRRKRPLDNRSPEKLPCYVSPETVFESFAEIIPSFETPDHRGLLIVETSAHPCFRHAYPYDAKVFIMSPPGSMEDVFRPAQETAGAIERAMHDTAEFAAELFGLERVDPHDSAWFRAHEDPNRDYSSDTQTVEEFLDSPIGIEITARLQLRPMFQGVVDADVVFLNTAVATNMKTLAACAQRIERILEPVNTRLQRRTYFAAGDPLDRRNAGTEGCLKRIADLLSAAKTIHA